MYVYYEVSYRALANVVVPLALFTSSAFNSPKEYIFFFLVAEPGTQRSCADIVVVNLHHRLDRLGFQESHLDRVESRHSELKSRLVQLCLAFALLCESNIGCTCRALAHI